MKLFMLLLLVSCASKQAVKPHYTVAIDSLSSPQASGKTFVIVSGDKAVPDNDLRFQEYAKITENALKADGFVPVLSNPDVKILLTYGIGEPTSHTVVKSVPVYGHNNLQVANAWGQNIGKIQTFGHKGYKTSSKTITQYKRTIVLRAVDEKSNEPVWETVLTSSGASSDLKEAFPFMVYAGTKHYATSTKAEYDIDTDSVKANGLRAPASP